VPDLKNSGQSLVQFNRNTSFTTQICACEIVYHTGTWQESPCHSVAQEFCTHPSVFIRGHELLSNKTARLTRITAVIDCFYYYLEVYILHLLFLGLSFFISI